MCMSVTETHSPCSYKLVVLGGGVVVNSVYPEQLTSVYIYSSYRLRMLCVCLCVCEREIIYETYDQYINIYIVHDTKNLIIFLNSA